MHHCDQHVIKMILESAQMLCTAVVITGGTAPYAPVHRKHPCTLWVLESLSNWRWLKSLVEALNNEYRFRYKKDINHKSYDVVNTLIEPNIEDKGITKFALAMPDEFRDDDPVLAYRKYYAGAKYKFATWKNREIPNWYIKLRKEFGGDATAEVANLLNPEMMKQKRKESRERNKEESLIKQKKNNNRGKKNKISISENEEFDSINEKNKVKNISRNKTSNLEILSGVKTRKMADFEAKSKLAEEIQKKPQKRAIESILVKKKNIKR